MGSSVGRVLSVGVKLMKQWQRMFLIMSIELTSKLQTGVITFARSDEIGRDFHI